MKTTQVPLPGVAILPELFTLQKADKKILVTQIFVSYRLALQ